MTYTEVAYYIETLHRCRRWPSKPLTHFSSRYSMKSVDLMKLPFHIVQNTSKQKAREMLLFSVLLPLHSTVCDYSCLAIHLANTLLQFTMHRILKRMMKPYDQLVKVSCSGTSHITHRTNQAPCKKDHQCIFPFFYSPEYITN